MKKLVLSALVLVLVFALAGYATETRVMTMGDANNIVKDVNNIWMYPSTNPSHLFISVVLSLSPHSGSGSARQMCTLPTDMTPNMTPCVKRNPPELN